MTASSPWSASSKAISPRAGISGRQHTRVAVSPSVDETRAPAPIFGVLPTWTSGAPDVGGTAGSSRIVRRQRRCDSTPCISALCIRSRSRTVRRRNRGPDSGGTGEVFGSAVCQRCTCQRSSRLHCQRMSFPRTSGICRTCSNACADVTAALAPCALMRWASAM